MSRKLVQLTVLQPSPKKDDGLVHCLDCGKCCTYVAVGINALLRRQFAQCEPYKLQHRS